MKRILTILFFGVSWFAQAQERHFEGALYTTGGQFAAQANEVKAYVYRHAAQAQNQLTSFLGDFSNDVIVDGFYAYAHIGRGFSHPAGSDMIVKINLGNGNVVDSTNVNVAGLQKMAIHNNLLLYNRGFGASGNYLVALNKDDLSQQVYLDNTLPANTSDMTIYNDTAYLAYTHNDSGKVALFDLNGTQPNFLSTIELDTLSAGLQNIAHTGTSLVMNHVRYDQSFNIMYHGITTYDALNGAVTDTLANGLGSFFDQNNTQILGNFGVQLQWWDPTANSFHPIHNGGFTSAFYDDEEDLIVAQSTDYSTVGDLHVFNQNGVEVESFSTDISGTAIAPIYNHHKRVNDSLFYLDASLTLDLDPTVIDIGDEATVTSALIIGATNLPVDQLGFSGSSLTVFNNHSSNIDTVVVNYSDGFGRAYIDTVYLSYNLTSTEEEVSLQTFSIFPNPVGSHLNLSLDHSHWVEGTANIYSINGALLRKLPFQKSMDVNDLESGVYILCIETKNGKFQQKFIKR